MISARMDRQIIIQQQTVTYNDYGEPQTLWSNLVTVWAKAKQQSARETWAAGKVSEVEMAFEIRYRSGVDTTCRVVYDGTNYDITGVREIGRQDGLEIMARVVE